MSVLAPLPAGRAPDPGLLRRRIAAVPLTKVKGTVGAVVIDVASGRTVYASGGARPLIPASTAKLLTVTAALSILGPDRRFATRVVAAAPGRVILVGGGDPYLASSRAKAATYPARASLEDLATRTAARLRSTGVRSVTLGYDASLFSGPDFQPAWPAAYHDQVSRVSALWLDEGRGSGYSPGPRAPNPAATAATFFARALIRAGVRVTGTPAPARAPRAAPAVAAIWSLPLRLIVEQVLLHSDNDGAEVLLRQAALGAGRPGSFADGVAVVHSRLAALGVWRPGTSMRDGSGLSRATAVPPVLLASLLRLAASPAHPELRPVLTGLPVAAVEGSLRSRFFEPVAAAGRGVVHAKTGTLRKVHSLAGYAVTRQNSLVVFAFIVNNPKNDFEALVWLDDVSSAVASCGC